MEIKAGDVYALNTGNCYYVVKDITRQKLLDRYSNKIVYVLIFTTYGKIYYIDEDYNYFNRQVQLGNWIKQPDYSGIKEK